MPIKFKSDYAFAHGGLRVERFKAGQVVENPSPELSAAATADGAIETGEEPEEAKSEAKKTKVKA